MELSRENINVNTERLLVIEASSLLNKSFYASAQQLKFVKTEEQIQAVYDKLRKAEDGTYTNGIYVFFETLLKVIREHGYTHLAVTLNGPVESTFRRKLYSGYKTAEVEQPQPLKEQLETLVNVLGQIDVPVFSSEVYEANDFIGSIAKKFEKDIRVNVLGRDENCLQIVSENTSFLMDTGKAESMYKGLGVSEDEVELKNIPKGVFEFTPEYVKHFYGVEPTQIIDVMALDGNEDVPGVTGVGPTASIPLIVYYGDMSKLYDDIDGLDAAGIKEKGKFYKDNLKINRSPVKKLMEYKEDAFLSKQLVKMDTELNEVESLELDDLSLNKIDIEKVKDVFAKLGMCGLI